MATKGHATKRKKNVRRKRQAPFPVPISSITNKACDKDVWYQYTGEVKGDFVIVNHSGDITYLYNMGFFGRGLMSRGHPSAYNSLPRVHLPTESGGTEMTRVMRKRMYLRHMGWKRKQDCESPGQGGNQSDLDTEFDSDLEYYPEESNNMTDLAEKRLHEYGSIKRHSDTENSCGNKVNQLDHQSNMEHCSSTIFNESSTQQDSEVEQSWESELTNQDLGNDFWTTNSTSQNLGNDLLTSNSTNQKAVESWDNMEADEDFWASETPEVQTTQNTNNSEKVFKNNSEQIDGCSNKSAIVEKLPCDINDVLTENGKVDLTLARIDEKGDNTINDLGNENNSHFTSQKRDLDKDNSEESHSNTLIRSKRRKTADTSIQHDEGNIENNTKQNSIECRKCNEDVDARTHPHISVLEGTDRIVEVNDDSNVLGDHIVNFDNTEEVSDASSKDDTQTAGFRKKSNNNNETDTASTAQTGDVQASINDLKDEYIQPNTIESNNEDGKSNIDQLNNNEDEELPLHPYCCDREITENQDIVSDPGGYNDENDDSGATDKNRTKNDESDGFGATDKNRTKNDESDGFGATDKNRTKDDESDDFGATDKNRTKDDESDGFGDKQCENDDSGATDKSRTKDDESDDFGEEDCDVLVIDDSDVDDGAVVVEKKERYRWLPVRKNDIARFHEPLVLALEEAYYLSYCLGCLTLQDGDHKALTLADTWRRFCAQKPCFLPLYAAYHFFRCKGWVPKPGILFGADIMLYKVGPPFYHATYSVIVKTVLQGSFEELPEYTNRNLSWASLAGLNRVTEHVAKTLLYCYVILPSDWTDTDKLSPNCLQNIKIRVQVVNRWVSSHERDVAKVAEDD